jgi:hypothetical protein
LFFVSCFSSLVWLIYAGLFVRERFVTVDLTSVEAYTLALYVGLLLIPVWIVWQVFGFINQYFKTKSTDKKLEQLFTQMKKNQDYTDLVVRVMLDAEHEIKDGFVISKFDVFVADMNEILADIAQRSNAASSVKIGELWARVKNGERWSIAKTFIENAKTHSDFEGYLKDKANRDKIFKGTLLEFCARYQNLSNMLEKHDRDRVFITILQTGVMGRVYAMLAPIVLGIEETENQQEQVVEPEEKDFDISPSIEQMEEPEYEKPQSMFKKMNPFSLRKKEKKKQNQPEQNEQTDDEAFFWALKQRMTEPEEKTKQEPVFNVQENDAAENEPRFEISMEAQNENETFLKDEIEEHQQKSLQAFLEEPVSEIKEETKEPEDDLAYPFGGWTNEDNN